MCGKLSRIVRIIAAASILLLAAGMAGFAQTADRKVTRAELIARISDYFAWPHPTEYNDIWKVPLRQLKDVKAGDTYARQIDVAVEEGIIDVDASGSFYPDKEVSRQDAAVVFARAFKVPAAAEDLVAKFSDAKTVKPAARDSLNALLAQGYMAGKTDTELKPSDPITAAEVNAIFTKITSTIVSPVQAVPKTNAVAPRRYVKLWCPTPGATIYFTDDGTTPTAASPVYTVKDKGHINEMLSDAQLPSRDVVYKAIAVKDGLAVSPVQTFVWHLYRPAVDDFQHTLILAKTATRPAIYRICNDAESVRAMAWYIEGSKSGIVFDALQISPNVKNLKEYVDKKIAKVPNVVVIGHEHGDHDAQAPNFMKAGVAVYANKRGWSALGSAGGPFPAVFATAAEQARIKNIEEGDVLNLGNVKLNVYAFPGHANGNIVLQDKANGLIFASDIYGCTRAGSADNVAVTGVKVDLLLSFAQQIYSKYRENGGKTVMLFTGHDETPLADVNFKLFEQALQQIVDYGEGDCSPTLRGKNNAPYSRTALIGDMWRDGTQWISLLIGGIMGDTYEYLTRNDAVNYNGEDGFNKYSVLSNIEIAGGDLVGTTVSWQPEPKPFSWAGSTISVPNSLPDRFDPWTYAYTVNVPKAGKSITITPTAMSTRIMSMTLNGEAIQSRSRNTVAVSNGSVVTIDILAPDGVTTSTYTFTIVKK